MPPYARATAQSLKGKRKQDATRLAMGARAGTANEAGPPV